MDFRYEVWHRRSRLRSATRLLSVIEESPEGNEGPSTPKIFDNERSQDLRKDSATTNNAGDGINPESGSGPHSTAKNAGVEREDGDCDDPDYMQFLKYLKTAGRKKPQKHQREDRECECDDPEYIRFLKYLKTDGNSYVYEIEIGNVPLRWKYEEEVDHFVANVTGNAAASRSRVRRGNVRDARKRSVKRNCAMGDEDYRVFLSHVKAYNGSMVLELGNVIVTYEEEEAVAKEEKDVKEEEEEEEEETVEVLQELMVKSEDLKGESSGSNNEMALQPYDGPPQPSISSACEEKVFSMRLVGYKLPSLFENTLVNFTEKPFDQTEYDNLMSLATIRKPKMKLIHLRNTSKFYETDELGSSYFDQYPDLAKKIKCSDRSTRLYLLRCFFYWLKNVVHDGAFMPWVLSSESYKALTSSGYDPMHPIQLEK